MQAFHLDTILSKGIKAIRGFKTTDPFLRSPWLNVPFLWVSLQLLIFPPGRNWPVTALSQVPRYSLTPQNFIILHQSSRSLLKPPSCTCFFGLWTLLCWCHLFKNCLLSLYCNRLPVITCSWWSCTSGWAPQSEWVDMTVGPVLLDHMSARRGRCTVPGHI